MKHPALGQFFPGKFIAPPSSLLFPGKVEGEKLAMKGKDMSCIEKNSPAMNCPAMYCPNAIGSVKCTECINSQ